MSDKETTKEPTKETTKEPTKEKDVLGKVLDEEIYTGVVKWFNSKVGYGFITCLNKEYQNKDIFVHHSALIGEQKNDTYKSNDTYKYLVEGEYVEFQLIHDHNNSKHPIYATNVSGILKQPLMFFRRFKDVRHKKPFPI